MFMNLGSKDGSDEHINWTTWCLWSLSCALLISLSIPCSPSSCGKGDGRNLPVRKPIRSIRWALMRMAGGLGEDVAFCHRNLPQHVIWQQSWCEIIFCVQQEHPPTPDTDLPFNFSTDEHGPSKLGFTSSNPAQTKTSGMALTQQQTDLNPCNHHGSQKYCC